MLGDLKAVERIMIPSSPRARPTLSCRFKVSRAEKLGYCRALATARAPSSPISQFSRRSLLKLPTMPASNPLMMATTPSSVCSPLRRRSSSTGKPPRRKS
ncbi:hypothetical protein Mapa_017575 [Marchantia paleacea]|nr:hypothetical protein Mapa_017575 [Marchantia paleacea]